MKEITITTELAAFQDLEQLDEQDRNLLRLAHEALKDAYAPYSDFHVGAAVLLANGEMIKGSNQENAAYTMCLCAERVALAAAASLYSGVEVKAIAVTAKNPAQPVTQPVSPCGACRQTLCETEYKQKSPMRVLMQGESGAVYILKSAKVLLPLLFDGSFLAKK